jgi:hypothetical protein
MVGFSPASSYQHVPDLFRKWNIDEMVGMHVPDFPPPKAIFRASKAVRLCCDPRPGLQNIFYSFAGS